MSLQHAGYEGGITGDRPDAAAQVTWSVSVRDGSVALAVGCWPPPSIHPSHKHPAGQLVTKLEDWTQAATGPDPRVYLTQATEPQPGPAPEPCSTALFGSMCLGTFLLCMCSSDR
jgi:hypothetical protein